MNEPWSDGAGPLFLEKKTRSGWGISVLRTEVLFIPCPVALLPCCLTTGRGQHCNFREDQSQPISHVGSRLLQRPGSHPPACPIYINIYTSIRYMILYGVLRTPQCIWILKNTPGSSPASRKAKRQKGVGVGVGIMREQLCIRMWWCLHRASSAERRPACLPELLTQLPLLQSIR